MKIKSLTLALLSLLSLPVLAAGDDSGPYLVGMLGTASNISNINDSTSATGLIGYQLNDFLAVEGGMGLLFDKAAYTSVQANGNTASSMAGSQFAALIGLPLLDWASVYVRMGFASLERTYEVNGVTSLLEESWKGSIMGLGVQFIIPHEFSISDARLQIGFRAGIDRYSLSNNAGTLTETPLNSYVGGVILF